MNSVEHDSKAAGALQSAFFAPPSHLESAKYPAWALSAIAAAARWCMGLPCPLHGRADSFFERLRQGSGGRSLAELLYLPWATPFFSLMDVYAADRNIDRNGEYFYRIGEGALFLYFGVRVQDDVVDEPLEFERAAVYLMESFLGASARAFAAGVGHHPEFWAMRDEIMCTFNNTALIEAAGREGDLNSNLKEFDGDSYLWMGRKFFPMAVPLAAIACRSGHSSDWKWLLALVESFGAGLQMINDIFNSGEDHRDGRQTPVLEALRRHVELERDTPVGYVRAHLNSSPALAWAIAIAQGHMKNAYRIAVENHVIGIANLIQERIGLSELVPSKLLALCFGAGVHGRGGQ